MVRTTRSKTAPHEPENVQMLTDEDPKVKKRGHGTNTENDPRKKVPFMIITFKHLLAYHDTQYID